jgi:exodeoxyribonuclease VII small subunit
MDFFIDSGPCPSFVAAESKIGAEDRRSETLDRQAAPRQSCDMTSESPQPSFEEALKALEEIVRKLESGEAPLDESIALYEQGHKLRALCQARLDAAQAKIEQIVLGTDGAPAATRPFDAD